MHYFSSRVRTGRGKRLLFGLAMVVSWSVAGSWALGQTADNEPPTASSRPLQRQGPLRLEGPRGGRRPLEGRRRRDRLRRPERGQGRQEPLERAASSATSSCTSTGGSRKRPYINQNVPYILPDGTHAKDIHGKEMKLALPDADSGVFLRGIRAITRSTSGAGRSARARCTASAPTRRRRPRSGPPSRPGRRPTSRSASGTIRDHRRGARRSRWS